MKFPRRHALILTCTAFLLAGCGDSNAPDNNGGDSTTTAAMAPQATEPRVMAIDFGQAVDDSGRVVGGGVESFQRPDTIYVSLRTQNATAGTPMTVLLSDGGKTIDSASVVVGTPDAAGVSRTLATLPGGVTLAAGSYKIEVLLDGASQGIRRFSIGS